MIFEDQWVVYALIKYDLPLYWVEDSHFVLDIKMSRRFVSSDEAKRIFLDESDYRQQIWTNTVGRMQKAQESL